MTDDDLADYLESRGYPIMANRLRHHQLNYPTLRDMATAMREYEARGHNISNPNNQLTKEETQ